jgi:hypothetical protein
MANLVAGPFAALLDRARGAIIGKGKSRVSGRLAGVCPGL